MNGPAVDSISAIGDSRRPEAAAEAKTRAARESLDKHLALERAAISSQLAAGVERIVADSLRDQVRLKLTRSLALAVVAMLALAACCFAGGAWMGRTRAATDVAHRYAWVETPVGMSAKELVGSGALALLRSCQDEGGRFVTNSGNVATCSVGREVTGKTAIWQP